MIDSKNGRLPFGPDTSHSIPPNDSSNSALKADLNEKSSGSELQKRRRFVAALIKSLMFYGSPSNQTDRCVDEASTALAVDVEVILLPGVTITYFSDGGVSSNIEFIKSGSRNNLSALDAVHRCFSRVMNGTISVDKGTAILLQLMKQPARYPKFARLFIAFTCAFIVCSTAYNGSLVDMSLSGLLGTLLVSVQLSTGKHHTVVFGNVIEITASIFISFMCKGLGSIQSNEGGTIFCYNAISSAAITSLLPGFVILVASVELSARTRISGALRMVYALMYTTFLGFGLTLGASWWTSIRSIYAPPSITSTVNALTITETVHGRFTSFNVTDFIPNDITLGISNSTSASLRIVGGCVRPVDSPFYLQPLPWWTLIVFVPIYTTFSSLKNQQEWKSYKLPAMVILACLSYTANKLAHRWVSGDAYVPPFAGAFVLGFVGNIASIILRNGTERLGAFTLIVTGVNFLVPSGLGQSGIFVKASSSSAEYLASINLCLGIVQIAAGVAAGLHFSSGICIFCSGILSKVFRKKHWLIKVPAF